ncbi:MAG TPA: hypothetical protein PLP93_09655 [Nitrosomonas sp.]|nr:hypothetical protein [Nitrosomonas sp.]
MKVGFFIKVLPRESGIAFKQLAIFIVEEKISDTQRATFADTLIQRIVFVGVNFSASQRGGQFFTDISGKGGLPIAFGVACSVIVPVF